MYLYVVIGRVPDPEFERDGEEEAEEPDEEEEEEEEEEGGGGAIEEPGTQDVCIDELDGASAGGDTGRG